MKKLSGLFLTAFIGLFSVSLFLSCSSDSSEENNKNKEPEPSVDNVESMARKLGMGWNLGNQMDAYNNEVASETAWGNKVATPALFKKLKAAGISTVRIPVTWLGQYDAANGYAIKKEWLDRVAQLVDYAEEAGLNAIINIHHDGGHWLDIKTASTDVNKNKAVKEQIAAMWQQIATRFADKGHFLIFEAFNEIHDGGWGWGENRKDGGKQYATLNDWNQLFVNTVRSTGGKNTDRWLAVPSYCTNPAYAVDGSFILPEDASKRLIVAVHFYDPTDYTLEAKFTEWGHTAAAGKKASWGDEDNAKSTMEKLKAKWIDNGIPVYIGEMGNVRRDNARDESFRKYYLEYVCKAAHDCNIAPIYWDNGSADAGRECSGLFDRATGEYLNNGGEIVAAMVKGATSEEKGYTLKSVYDSAPK